MKTTHFLAIRITNPVIIQRVTKIQEDLHKKQPELAEAFPPIPTFHITLNQLSLENQNDITDAIICLKKSEKRLESIMKKYLEKGFDPNLHFPGLNTFSNEQGDQVLFVDMNTENIDLLKEIVEMFRETFKPYDIYPVAEKPFRPHATVVNMNQCRESMDNQKISKIERKLFADQMDADVGDKILDKIFLCDAQNTTEDGFYEILSEINIV